MEDCNFENILANFHSGNYKTLLRVPKEVRAKFWEACLGVYSDESKARRRDLFDQLCEKHHVHNTQASTATTLSRLEHADAVDWDVVNPLSLDRGNPWNQNYKDAQLRQEIEQDTLRIHLCTSEDPYDADIAEMQSWIIRPDVQGKLVSVLFVLAHELGSLSYRQGMHEIVAHVFVAVRQGCDFDENYLSHDSFAISWAILAKLRRFFDSSVSNKDVADFITGKLLLPKASEALRRCSVQAELWLPRHQRLLLLREFNGLFDRLLAWDHVFAFEWRLPGFEPFQVTDSLAECFGFALFLSGSVLNYSLRDVEPETDESLVLHWAVKPVSLAKGDTPDQLIKGCCQSVQAMHVAQDFAERKLDEQLSTVQADLESWLESVSRVIPDSSAVRFKSILYRLNRAKLVAQRQAVPQAKKLSIKDFKTKPASPPVWKQSWRG